MAKFVITGPDGAKYQINAPDDATEEQVLAYAQSQFKKPEQTKEKFDPTEGMSGTDKFLAGMGKAFTDVGRGVGQLFGQVSAEDVQESNRLDQALMDTGAGTAGNIFGNVAMVAPTAFVPGANTVTGAALAGSLYGALQPTENENIVSGKLSNAALGAGMGGGSVLAGRGIAAGAKGAKALIEPFTKKGQEAIVGRTLERFGRMGKNMDVPANTSGWVPTLAERTQNPGFAILQRGAQSADPDTAALLAARQLEQNAAAIRALEKLGGTGKDLELAKGVRGLMTEQLYKEAGQEGIDKGMSKAIATQIKSLMERPSMMKATEKAKEIFGEESIALAKSGSVKGLQYMKQSLDDMIEKAGSPASSIGKNQLKALQQTRADLISVIDDIAPKQRLADQNYRIYSRPVNEMMAARELANKVQGPLMDFAPGAPARLRADQFAGAVRNLDEQLPRMTGYPGATVENTMSPGGLNTIRGIAGDLAARAQAAELARGVGSNTAQNLASQNIMRQVAGPLGMPQRFMESQIWPTALRPLQFGMKAQEPAIQARLAQALLNPDDAMNLMRIQQTPGGAEIMARLLGQYVIPPAGIALGASAAQ